MRHQHGLADTAAVFTCYTQGNALFRVHPPLPWPDAFDRPTLVEVFSHSHPFDYLAIRTYYFFGGGQQVTWPCPYVVTVCLIYAISVSPRYGFCSTYAAPCRIACTAMVMSPRSARTITGILAHTEANLASRSGPVNSFTPASSTRQPQGSGPAASLQVSSEGSALTSRPAAATSTVRESRTVASPLTINIGIYAMSPALPALLYT